MLIPLHSILIAFATFWTGCTGTAFSGSGTESRATQDVMPAGELPRERQDNEPVQQPEEMHDDQEEAIPAHLDALLDRLEASAADLKGFTAGITYDKYDDVIGRNEIRQGEILYRVDQSTGNKTFAILFDLLVIGRRRQDRLKHFIFDGRWLAEIDHDAKQFIMRELVAPGQRLDPLKLGEGPIPLPIGQAKVDVLKRFEVSDTTLPEDGQLKKIQADSYDAIRLTPRSGTTESNEFKHIDLFYDRATSLPVGILVFALNGDTKTVRLNQVQRNPQFTPEMLEKLDLNDPDPVQWHVVKEHWADGI